MKEPVKVRIEEADLAALARRAKEHERTVAAEIRIAVREYLGRWVGDAKDDGNVPERVAGNR